MSEEQERIISWLNQAGPLAVAVSGGVDSMTLAVLAAHTCPETILFHAVSPAVPAAATSRVRAFARRLGWQLVVIDAGEFADQDYLNNPVNRCFYCKRSLYCRIAAKTSLPIVSGTNTDDLSDFRPGLQAAANQGVRHPWVESACDKAAIRRIAAERGLGDLAELPASPCLSSRVETGTPIDGDLLPVVDEVESTIREAFAADTARCRVRSTGIVIELDQGTLSRLSSRRRRALLEYTRRCFARAGLRAPVSMTIYRMGSAFIDKEKAHG